jgi:hypothetical protein
MAQPSVRTYENYNNAFGIMKLHGDSLGGGVLFLGTYKAQHKNCQKACIQAPRCHSYIHFKKRAPPSLAGHCYAVTTPGFNPTYDETAITGVVDRPCQSDDDCSLNGICSKGGSCLCRAAWSGHRCEMLVTLPAKRSSGYHGKDGGRNASSWGAAVLRWRKDGLYHMWASEMTEHCGIGAWQHNSRIIHATSSLPNGAYVRKEVTWPVFAHAPSVVPGPQGEFVMFFTADLERTAHEACNCCRAGHGPCDGSTGPGDCADLDRANASRPVVDLGFTYMSWTKDPNGGWSTPVKLFSSKSGDTNFSPLILANGSVVGMYRRWVKAGSRSGSRVFMATARDWRDPASYEQHRLKWEKGRQRGGGHLASGELFPELGASGAEDQFLYRDEDGRYHAFFHNMVGTGTAQQWWLDPTGGHAFSRNGLDWTYGGVAWGDPLARYDTPNGRGARVLFDDGSSARLTRFERPHFIFAGDELRGDPTHLVASAQYGDGLRAGISDAGNSDGSCTMILPVRGGDDPAQLELGRGARGGNKAHVARGARLHGAAARGGGSKAAFGATTPAV